MNYYEHHLGDYVRDTVGLSMIEEGAYRRLIDAYYVREAPLPHDVIECNRLARAVSKADRDAVAYVLRTFFVNDADGWRQRRCDAEIERFKGKSVAAKKSAAARWSKTESNANGEAIGMRTHSEGNALQSPDTSLQKRDRNPTGSSSAKPTVPCPYQDIVDLYHEILPELPKVRLMPPARQKALRKTWGWALSTAKPDGTPRATNAAEALAWFRNYFDRTRESDFLMGRTPRSPEHANWQCDLDFLLTDAGMKHVIEKTRTGT